MLCVLRFVNCVIFLVFWENMKRIALHEYQNVKWYLKLNGETRRSTTHIEGHAEFVMLCVDTITTGACKWNFVRWINSIWFACKLMSFLIAFHKVFEKKAQPAQWDEFCIFWNDLFFVCRCRWIFSIWSQWRQQILCNVFNWRSIRCVLDGKVKTEECYNFFNRIPSDQAKLSCEQKEHRRQNPCTHFYFFIAYNLNKPQNFFLFMYPRLTKPLRIDTQQYITAITFSLSLSVKPQLQAVVWELLYENASRNIDARR